VASPSPPPGPDRRARNERGWAGLIPHYVEACAATV
jgi:hypothetical protein